MKIPKLHSWNLSPKAAVALQKNLADRIDASSPLAHVDLIAGADISYNRFSNVMYAAVLILRAKDCSVVEVQNSVRETDFPYVPGLLSFREAPALLDAFAKIKTRPDAVMIDGQGFAHPRRFGIACHIGLWLNLPTIGCAKSRLVGTHKDPGDKRGASRALVDNMEIIGRVVRTKNDVKPLFVSVGNRIDLASAVKWTLRLSRGYRIPEPTRLAHIEVNKLRREAKG